MAADLYMMSHCPTDTVILRLYRWEPASITLGYMQRPRQQLHFESLLRDTVDWIRRPTGGRAVLHKEDLTYSCIFSRELSRLGTSVESTYAIITRCLAGGLSDLGIVPAVKDSASALIKSDRSVKLPCFLAPNRNEIMVNDRKLIGSAQYRSATAVLQHGSLPLTPAYRELPLYMPVSQGKAFEQQRLLARKSIALSEIDPSITLDHLIEALKKGFSRVLELPLTEENWNDTEMAEISDLMASGDFIERWCGEKPVAVR
jgi:lipoyl(octanoyl) transferase